MYKLRYFLKDCCKHSELACHYKGGILNYPMKCQFLRLAASLRFLSPCRSECYAIFCYWYVIMLSIVGIATSAKEFVATCRGERQCPKMFRFRKYHWITQIMRRNGRLVGSAFVGYINTRLILGMIWLDAPSLNAWLIVQATILLMETIFWLIDLSSANELASSKTLATFALMIYNLYAVYCTKHNIQTGALNAYLYGD